jgi:hypothetical protein
MLPTAPERREGTVYLCRSVSEACFLASSKQQYGMAVILAGGPVGFEAQWGHRTAMGPVTRSGEADHTMARSLVLDSVCYGDGDLWLYCTGAYETNYEFINSLKEEANELGQKFITIDGPESPPQESPFSLFNIPFPASKKDVLFWCVLDPEEHDPIEVGETLKIKVHEHKEKTLTIIDFHDSEGKYVAPYGEIKRFLPKTDLDRILAITATVTSFSWGRNLEGEPHQILIMDMPGDVVAMLSDAKFAKKKVKIKVGELETKTKES